MLGCDGLPALLVERVPTSTRTHGAQAILALALALANSPVTTESVLWKLSNSCVDKGVILLLLLRSRFQLEMNNLFFCIISHLHIAWFVQRIPPCNRAIIVDIVVVIAVGIPHLLARTWRLTPLHFLPFHFHPLVHHPGKDKYSSHHMAYQYSHPPKKQASPPLGFCVLIHNKQASP